MYSGIGIHYLYQKGAKVLGPSFCALILFLNFIPGYGAVASAYRNEPVVHKRMGKWIADHIKQPQVILSTDRRTCFYAESVCKQFIPVSSVGEPLRQGKPFEQFLKENKIDLVVLDTHSISQSWPSLTFLLEKPTPEFLFPLVTISEGENQIFLYRFESHKAQNKPQRHLP